MHFIDAPEEIVEVAHDILVSTHQKETEVIRLELPVSVCVQFM